MMNQLCDVNFWLGFHLGFSTLSEACTGTCVWPNRLKVNKANPKSWCVICAGTLETLIGAVDAG